jgi:hypothetical protein
MPLQSWIPCLKLKLRSERVHVAYFHVRCRHRTPQYIMIPMYPRMPIFLVIAASHLVQALELFVSVRTRNSSAKCHAWYFSPVRPVYFRHSESPAWQKINCGAIDPKRKFGALSVWAPSLRPSQSTSLTIAFECIQNKKINIRNQILHRSEISLVPQLQSCLASTYVFLFKISLPHLSCEYGWFAFVHAHCQTWRASNLSQMRIDRNLIQYYILAALPHA